MYDDTVLRVFYYLPRRTYVWDTSDNRIYLLRITCRAYKVSYTYLCMINLICFMFFRFAAVFCEPLYYYLMFQCNFVNLEATSFGVALNSLECQQATCFILYY